MISAPLPQSEQDRLAVLKRYEILDTLPEQAYDDLLTIAAGICGTSMGAVSLIDSDRQWFKARRGLPVQETSRDIAFCAHAILYDNDIMVVPDTLADIRFHDNPLVMGMPNIRFYAGAPLVGSNGEAIGTLCVIDEKPHELTAFQRRALESLSRQVVALLELRLAHKELRKHVSERGWYEQQLELHHRELIAENMQLSEMSRTDALTGLLNRRAFNLAMEHAVAAAATNPATLAMAIIDIDHFKAINDLRGHPAGDAALVTIAHALRVQIQEGATIARFGGEEFAVVLPGRNIEQALQACERMRAAIEELPQDMPLTVSVGVAAFRVGDCVGDLYARADKALYAAKHAGRNRVVIE